MLTAAPKFVTLFMLYFQCYQSKRLTNRVITRLALTDI